MVDDAPLIAAYQAGASAAELGERFDIAAKTVLNRLARAGVPLRRRGRPQQLTQLDNVGWLRREYVKRGRSAADLAREAGCSPTAVLTALHRHGIAIRPRGGGIRTTAMPDRIRDTEWLRQHYSAGASIRVIASQLGVSGSAVAVALRRAGIPRRPLGNSRPACAGREPARAAVVRRRVRRSGPIGVLEDGTEYFVSLGTLDFIDDDTPVRCHLCGNAFRLLSATHLRGHGWTPAEYREAFGLNRDTPLCAPTVSAQRRAAGIDRYANNLRVREGMAIGQEMVRSGVAHRMARAAAPAGSARLQRRLGAADVTASSRRRRHADAVAQRKARVRELGFATERAYLRDRYQQQGWGITRIKSELHVGSGVVEQLLDTARIARRAPGGGAR